MSARKKLAIVDPSGDPILTPSYCWYNLFLCMNIPCVAIRSNFMKNKTLQNNADFHPFDLQNCLDVEIKKNNYNNFVFAILSRRLKPVI